MANAVGSRDVLRGAGRLAVVVGAFLLLVLATTSTAGADEAADPAATLADRYRPIVQTRSQSEEWDGTTQAEVW
jgi:hypothetical protein